MTPSDYLENINEKYQHGNTTEHTFRGDLQQLIESIAKGIRATNEPKRQSCGAPDYILTKNGIPVGFIEAKNLGDRDLEGKKKSGNKEQFDRYKSSLHNLIFTDYLDFHLYQSGQWVTKVAIGELTAKGIKPLPQNFAAFEHLFTDFCTHAGQTIESSKELAKMMAGKARLLADVMEKAVTQDEEQQDESELKAQMAAFKRILIHDITPKGFADVYAQTIAYGLFAARLHDPNLATFSRQKAAELIPKSNPFLRKLFGYIAGPDIDKRIQWIVENLAEIFLACDVEKILSSYGKATKMENPIIHFYENFLAEYDPVLRKARGVWYTPAPVVSFMVRAVDDVLKTEFDLPQGLADTSKTKIKVGVQGKKIEQETHRVQILDPAVGTGTFLAEIIRHVHQSFKSQEGLWGGYVEQHLLPRLNGFELLMASYAMAHIQLDLLLKNTGFRQPNEPQRTRVYLTNSLEEHHPDTATLFASWLSDEANQANEIKRDTPIMCLIGNPPYSGESANRGDWIMELMEDYKKEPGGKEKLKERNSKWINDDYVKFLRYGQYFIEKNGSGVLAFINPHGFLDNPTFRGMRWHLLKTYDKIYTLDLHGNSKKKETAPDGSIDQNVFDIMQGVSINLLIKTGKKKAHELGHVLHLDLFGTRERKYDFLQQASWRTIPYQQLPNIAPNYFFVPKDFDKQKDYDQGFVLTDLFKLNGVGVVTARDKFTIHAAKQEVKTTIDTFLSLDNETARTRFNLGKDVRDWQINFAKKDLESEYPDKGTFTKISYRPFDARWTFYTGKSKGFHCMPRADVMQHFLKGENVGLICPKQVPEKENASVYISKSISGHKSCSAYNVNNLFPLYLYPNDTAQQSIETTAPRTPNLNPKIVKKIADGLGLTFVPEKPAAAAMAQDEGNNPAQSPHEGETFAPIDILDYIYAVLHSPTYREQYKAFLKIDFPKVPYPKDRHTFWQLVRLGEEIRQIHLLESPKVESYLTTYPKGGDHTITTKIGKKDWQMVNKDKQLGRIWINESQYFDQIPLVAWSFYIGGYQPAQKWLKDRKGKTLTYEDILHYQKIIVALCETHRLMKVIDQMEVKW